MENNYLTTLRHLLIDGIENEVECKKIDIANGTDIFFKFIQKEGFLHIFGISGLDSLKKYPFFYYNPNEEVKGDILKHFTIMTELYSRYTQNIILCLWLIKDNSVSSDTTYAYSADKNTFQYRDRTTQYCTSKGLFEDTIFTIDEIVIANAYALKLHSISETCIDITKVENLVMSGIQGSLLNNFDYNQMNRISKAWMFLELARSRSFLPLKISFYMSIFECLFSTDAELIAHKIGLRAAKYLGGNADEQKGIYDLVKDAYTLRSKFSHGQKLGERSKIEYQTKISNKIDNLIRVILKKIIDNDSDIFTNQNNDKKLENWFTSLLFT